MNSAPYALFDPLCGLPYFLQGLVFKNADSRDTTDLQTERHFMHIDLKEQYQIWHVKRAEVALFHFHVQNFIILILSPVMHKDIRILTSY